MTLNFPNTSRYFDERRAMVHFWGYDSALEISFFVGIDALKKFESLNKENEEEYLAIFDAALAAIHAAAKKVYSRNHDDAYYLSAADF